MLEEGSAVPPGIPPEGENPAEPAGAVKSCAVFCFAGESHSLVKSLLFIEPPRFIFLEGSTWRRKLPGHYFTFFCPGFKIGFQSVRLR